MLLALQKDLINGSPQRCKDVTLPMAGAKPQYLQSVCQNLQLPYDKLLGVSYVKLTQKSVIKYTRVLEIRELISKLLFISFSSSYFFFSVPKAARYFQVSLSQCKGFGGDSSSV